MFCALLGQDIRLAFTGPSVFWFERDTLQLHLHALTHHKSTRVSSSHWQRFLSKQSTDLFCALEVLLNLNELMSKLINHHH